jgi:hypothetical protein
MVYLFNFEGEGILILFIAINVISIRAQIAEIIIILLIVNYYIGSFIIYSKQINKQDIG